LFAPQIRQTFPLGRRTVIGRSPECHVVLQDEWVAWYHARIEGHKGGYVIADLSGEPGTYVNGVRIHTPHNLAWGDRVRVGDTTLVFQRAGVAELQREQGQRVITLGPGGNGAGTTAEYDRRPQTADHRPLGIGGRSAAVCSDSAIASEASHTQRGTALTIAFTDRPGVAPDPEAGEPPAAEEAAGFWDLGEAEPDASQTASCAQEAQGWVPDEEDLFGEDGGWRRKALGLLGALLVAGLGIWFAFRAIAPAEDPVAAAGSPNETAPAEQVIVAKGKVQASRSVSLSFPLGGQVAEVYVAEGDTVTAGQLLARLDDTDLEFQVQAAQETLALNAVQLTALQAKNNDADVREAESQVAAAQANLKSLRARYQRLKSERMVAEINLARANLEKARVAVQRAQAAYDRVAWRPDIGARPESRALQEATIEYEAAKANYEARVQALNQELQELEASIAQAQANLQAAEARLDKVRQGPAASEVEAAQIRLRQARIALERARAQLDKTLLKAPFAGTVMTLFAHPGEVVAGGSPVVTLADLSSLQVEAEVDELHVLQIATGQQARIRFNALPEQVFEATVRSISPRYRELANGDVVYPVLLTFDAQDLPGVRPGMTARVEFPLQEDEDVGH